MKRIEQDPPGIKSGHLGYMAVGFDISNPILVIVSKHDAMA